MEGKGEEKHQEVKGMKMERGKLEKFFLGRRKGEKGEGGGAIVVVLWL